MLGIGFFLLSAFGQTNSAPVTPLPDSGEPNILYAMYGQVIRNPSSLFFIGFLCVIAWLIDDLPFINSRYVPHCLCLFGGSAYWMFATPKSVPPNYPYPYVILVVNGVICAFIAFIIHRQAIARLINMIRARPPQDASPSQLKGHNDTSFLHKPEQP